MWRAVFKVGKAVMAVVAIPVAVIAGLSASPKKRSAGEVADYLGDFIEGRGGEWDWDDFTSVPIANDQLESVRRRAAAVDLPITDQGLTTLRELLGEVERVGAEF